MKIPNWLKNLFRGGITALQIWEWIVWGIGLLAIAATFVWGLIRDIGPIVIPMGLWTVVGVLFAREKLMAYLSTKRQIDVTPLAPASLPPFPPKPKEENQFFSQITVVKGEVDHTNLDRANPYLLFTFWFFNGSLVNQINFQKISGHVKVNEEEQSQEVQFFGDTNSNYGHGNWNIKIRQWLSGLAARTIKQMLDGPSELQFRFDAVNVMISCYGDESKRTVRLNLPIISKRDGRTWVTHV